MFRCDGDVMERDVFVGVFGGTKHTHDSEHPKQMSHMGGES